MKNVALAELGFVTLVKLTVEVPPGAAATVAEILRSFAVPVLIVHPDADPNVVG
jgi:hypothetical protein